MFEIIEAIDNEIIFIILKSLEDGVNNGCNFNNNFFIKDSI